MKHATKWGSSTFLFILVSIKRNCYYSNGYCTWYLATSPMWNTVSRPHAGEAQINTDFVRLLRNKNTPSFVLSDLAHVEAFPLVSNGRVSKNAFRYFPDGEWAKLPAAVFNSSGENGSQCKRKGNYVGSVPGHPLMGQKLHPCYLHVTLNFIWTPERSQQDVAQERAGQ